MRSRDISKGGFSRFQSIISIIRRFGQIQKNSRQNFNNLNLMLAPAIHHSKDFDTAHTTAHSSAHINGSRGFFYRQANDIDGPDLGGNTYPNWP